MRSAKAVIYEAPNQPFIVKTYPLRDATANEVLVKISMCTICRSDIYSYQGERPNPCPGILGHEIIGTIDQLGADISTDMRGDRLRVGDRITWTEYFFDGDCYYRDILNLPQKCHGVRKYGHDLANDAPHFLGGFAEYCYIVPGTGILKLPDELSDEEATPLNCGVATMACVTEAAAINLGDTVVVQGLGLLGVYGCAMAKSRGARAVIGIDSVPERLRMAKSFGADITLDLNQFSDHGLVDEVRRSCRPDGADVVLEVCGVADVIPSGLAMLRTGGCYILGGLVNPNAHVSIDANVLVRKMIRIQGIHNYHPRHLIQALDFVLANRSRYPFASIVDSKFSLDELDTAFAKAAERSVMRAAIVPTMS